MAHPKRRHSKARRDKRRAHDALPRPAAATCAHCGETKRPHHVCPHCGQYRGKEVLQVGDTL